MSFTHPALRDAGLDEGVAREPPPKHAFTRACKKPCDRRLIRQVAEDGAAVRVQFMAESREGDHYEYRRETILDDGHKFRRQEDHPVLPTSLRVLPREIVRPG